VLTAKNVAGYSIEYSYDFPDRASVHITDLGIVPAKGSFHYLSREKELEFRDPASGEVLQKVPLKETVIVAAKPPLNEVPGEAEFPLAFRAFSWRSSNSLRERADVVLGRYFRYQPWENDNTNYLVTTFAPLRCQGVQEGVFAQVALLVSFPYNKTARDYSLHVRSIVREGRTHSDEFRPTNDVVILQAADKFIEQLIAEMQAG
jgi:hypothetical protein